MAGDSEPMAVYTALVRTKVEERLAPGERLAYTSWVGRADQRRGAQPGLAGDLNAVLPDPVIPVVLAITDSRLLLLREAAPPGDTTAGRAGPRGVLEDIRRQMSGLMSSQPPVFGPIGALEVRWQAPRASSTHARVKWGSFADRVILVFEDHSSIALTAPNAKQLVAALTDR